MRDDLDRGTRKAIRGAYPSLWVSLILHASILPSLYQHGLFHLILLVVVHAILLSTLIILTTRLSYLYGRRDQLQYEHQRRLTEMNPTGYWHE